MTECGSGKTEMELRSLLGCFLFSGDDVEKKIKVLSGGEKARVALAKVIVSKANFLMLDEPTNHLDMHSVELLTEALNKYEGSIIFVSHDRYFISNAANKIWEIVDHQIKEFKGTYTEYVEWKERMAKQAKKDDSNKPAVDSNKQKEVVAPPVSRQQSSANTAQSREQQKELQRLQKEFSKAEEELEKLKRQQLQAEAAMAAPEVYADKNKFVKIESDYRSILQKVATATKEYETLFEKLMEMEEQAS